MAQPAGKLKLFDLAELLLIATSSQHLQRGVRATERAERACRLCYLAIAQVTATGQGDECNRLFTTAIA